jgi:hypothetical protein
MNRKLCWTVILAATVMLGGCYYTPVVVSPQETLQDRFERSWAAASGAMYDQGLTITSQDRGAGTIRGERGGVVITATVQTMADGSIQVKFNSANDRADPTLVDRVTNSYLRRKGA